MGGFEQVPAPEREDEFRESVEVNGIEITVAEVPHRGDYELMFGDELETIRVSRQKDVALQAFEEAKRLAGESASAGDLLAKVRWLLNDENRFPYDRDPKTGSPS
jgi:hypothetical protein